MNSFEELFETHRDAAGAEIVNFLGTCVPVSLLFQEVLAGGSLDTFLAAHPSVTRCQARDAIRFSGQRLAQTILQERTVL